MGATAMTMACRSGSLRVKPNSMPTPRSKPSSSTYSRMLIANRVTQNVIMTVLPL